LKGGSLVAALKASPEHRAIPIVMIESEDILPEQIGRYQPDCIVHKTGDMRTSLEAFLDSLGLVCGVAGTSSPTSLVGARILVAEDNKVNQAVIGRILHVAGAASAGFDAVLNKPVDRTLLVETCHKHIESAQAGSELEEPMDA
jgi:hypothetical protein